MLQQRWVRSWERNIHPSQRKCVEARLQNITTCCDNTFLIFRKRKIFSKQSSMFLKFTGSGRSFTNVARTVQRSLVFKKMLNLKSKYKNIMSTQRFNKYCIIDSVAVSVLSSNWINDHTMHVTESNTQYLKIFGT